MRTAMEAGARRDPDHPGRRPRVRPGRLSAADPAPDRVRPRRRRLRLALPRQRREPRPELLAHGQGNRLLTLISNVFTDLNLTDMATCYKAFHRRVVPSLDLESRRFGVDAEITAKVARGGFRVFEVPVSYFARSRAEGKKIRLKDGFSALGGAGAAHLRAASHEVVEPPRRSRRPAPPSSPWPRSGSSGTTRGSTRCRPTSRSTSCRATSRCRAARRSSTSSILRS